MTGRGPRRTRLTAMIAAAALLVAAAGAFVPWRANPVSAEEFNPVVRSGAIDGPLDVDWFVLFALAGESYAISLERNTLLAGEITIWKPATDESDARIVARSSGLDVPLIWTAPESGAWRAQVSGVRGATGSYRLRIRNHTDAIGSDLATAKLGAYDERGVLIERSAIDNAGDADWFAFPVASGNRYRIWSVLGSVTGLSAAIRLPGQNSFRELDRYGNSFSDAIEPAEGGLAVLEVRASQAWFMGSYAFGITRSGVEQEPEVSLPTRQMPRLQIESIIGTESGRTAQFSFQGEWGPIRQNSGLRVWIDIDPGMDEHEEWEFLLRSNDGRNARLWSFEQGAWIETSQVSASGFDTLVLRWSGRTSDQRIRWQASVKNWDGSWTVSRPSLLEIPDPQPPNPNLWLARQRTGAEDPRWQAELEEAGVIPGLDDEAIVVVLDAGHGVDTGAWDNGVKEEDSNLAFALRIEEMLEAEGVTVVQTRRSTDRPFLNLDEALWRADYQARAEMAHLARADVFVSIHSNANFMFPINGLEAWYLPRWNGDGLNLKLAETLLSHIQQALADYGYRTATLTYDSSCWELVNGACDPIYVLAPFLLMDASVARQWDLDPAGLGLSEDPWDVAINDWLWRNDITVGEPPIDLIDPETQSGPGRIVRANLMPTTLLELLYVTHEADAGILRDPQAREVIARAIADGILEFLDLE